MKKVILLIIFCAVFAGCENWLDTSGKQETREEELYKTEDGFKSSLIGVYTILGSEKLYGRYTSYFMPEMLARHWMMWPQQNNYIYKFANAQYRDPDVVKMLKEIWNNYYKAIVQLNSILDNIDSKENIFSNGNYEIIKGEALGLRAFIHFEVLRYFGPVPSLASASMKAIPYVETATSDPNLLVSLQYGEVVTRIERDLKAAEALLVNDPARSYNLKDLRLEIGTTERPADSWHYYRQRRMNYYAVKGIMSRFYMWTDNKSEAVRHAKEVIEAENEDGSPKFVLANLDYFNSSWSDLTLPTEHLFATHLQTLETVCQPYFAQYNQGSTLTQEPEILETGFESINNNNDWRYAAGDRYWKSGDIPGVNFNQFTKYTGSTIYTNNKLVPVMRLSELYLILIEALEWDVAEPYFVTYANSRNLNPTLSILITAGLEQKMTRVEKEYRKEFFGEGQMIHFYKRLNYGVYTWPDAFFIESANYVLPKPEGQTIFE